VLILLHRPFARYDDPSGSDSDDVNTSGISALDDHFSKASRAICTKSAVAMARLFWAHRQRFDTKRIFCIGMQHAGTAATALITALAYMPDAADRANNMQYLEVLQHALRDMAHAYHPAERMAAVLEAVMVELKGGAITPSKTVNSQGSSVPARRNSTAVEMGGERPMSKRRQTSRSSKSKALQPPGPAARQHRASDASDRQSIASQGLQVPGGDFVMVTPLTEGPSSSWPKLQASDMRPFQDNMMLPTPATATMVSPAQRAEWLNQLGRNDFATMPPVMSGTPGVVDTSDMGLGFLGSLPSEDDWSRWHQGLGDPGSDLDGFPPRGRLQATDFSSPPMGGIMNG
jgi:hypothetical protein